MDLSQRFTYTFSTEEVVFLRAFFKQGISKLGSGEFRDVMTKLQRDFETALLKSEIQDREAQRFTNANPDSF